MIGTELRYAWRSLLRQRASTALALTMLAMGIAANAVVFSLVNGLLLKPFPFSHADRLVYINETAPKWNLDVVGINYPDFWEWHEHATAFDAMAMYDDASFNLSDERGAERISGGEISRDFAAVLGLTPLLGRSFTVDEDRPNGPRAVILSERLWKERFQSDPQIAGKSLRLNGTAQTIVGVFPRIAEFPIEAALWVPFAGNPKQEYQSYGANTIARLKPGVTLAHAAEDLTRAHQAVWKARDQDKVVSPFVKSLRDELTRESRDSVPALVAAVVLLLVVACANVASIMLARAIARRREMGIRLAVGAGRARLMRQLFIENLLLAIGGAALGLLLGRIGLTFLVTMLDDQLPHWVAFSLDLRLAAFAAGVTVMTTLLFGWAPALHALRGDVRAAMTDSVSGSTSAPTGRRTLTWLVAAEFALAAVLLVGAGLLFRAFGQVNRVEAGFRPDHVLTFRLTLPAPAYAEEAKRLAFWDNLLTRIRATPGVDAAGVVNCPPLGCHWGYFYKLEDGKPRGPNEPNPVVLTRVASEDYFTAMGISLAKGRWFDLADRQPKGERTVIVNETFVRTFWPHVADPIGKHIGFNGSDEKTDIKVIGVAKDIKHYGFERPMRPGVYFPMSWPRTDNLVVTIRTTGDPGAFTATARNAVRSLDADLPMYQVRTMDEAVARSLRARAVYSWLSVVFASLAFLLALGGTYGVTSYLVTQRTREIGIRLAIGAQPRDILRTVLRSSIVATSVGTVLGLAGAVALAGLLGDLLFGVSPRDPVVIASSATVVLLAAFVANWLPAARAARTNPSSSLRSA